MESVVNAIEVINPIALSKEEYGDLSIRNVTKTKNLDCNNYNSCLNIAVKRDWANFTCRECTGYSAPDNDRKLLDLEGLTLAYVAAGHIQDTLDPDDPTKIGNAGRIVGVKGGAETRKFRLPILANRLNVSAREVMILG